MNITYSLTTRKGTARNFLLFFYFLGYFIINMKNSLKIQSLRAGKIKTRIFALMLLLVSCSFMISSYRSLSREFSGVVIRKSALSGALSTQYQLFLLPINDELDPEILHKAFTDIDYPLQRVGVSAVAYEQAQNLESVNKKSMSFTIKVGDSQLIDLGLFWFLLGFAGILISIWMHSQTLIRKEDGQPYPGEDLEIPGLD